MAPAALAQDLPGEAPELAPAPPETESIPDDTTRADHIDALFAQLADPERSDWERVQNQIFEIWRHSGSDAMDLLLRRAAQAIEARDYRTALLHLNDLTRLAPDFAEGWNQRATVYFLMEDYGRSMRDIERVLALEPRHFGALAGLGIILDRTGNPAGAVRAYRRALEIHPNLAGAKQGVERLAPEVDGREL